MDAGDNRAVIFPAFCAGVAEDCATTAWDASVITATKMRLRERFVRTACMFSKGGDNTRFFQSPSKEFVKPADYIRRPTVFAMLL